MRESASDNREIFEQWVNEYTDSLYSWALHKTSNRELAEDLVQETFLSAYDSLSKFRGESQPRTWLLSILNNKIIDHYRKSGRLPQMRSTDLSFDFHSILEYRYDEEGNWRPGYPAGDWSDDEHLLDNKDFIIVLEHCMSQLPDQWNRAVQLKYLESKKGESISKELGVSSSNYWQIIHRAKLFLRDCLNEMWFKSSK